VVQGKGAGGGGGTAVQAVKVVATKDMPREDWLAARRKGIGGSDAAAIVGLNPYCSAFQVYCDKMGLLPEQEDSEPMRQGRDFEAYVARRFEERTLAEGWPRKVRRENHLLSHPEFPFIVANVDRLVVGERAGLECKTTSVYNKTDFAGGDVPPSYYVQCQHYMAVTGFDRWYLAILILNKDFFVKEIARNEDDIDTLIKAEANFWENHVVKQIPPDPDGSERAEEALKRLYPKADEGLELVALYHKEDAIKEMMALRGEIERLERRKDELEQIIKAEIKDAQGGFCKGYTVTWKNGVRKILDGKLLKAQKPNSWEAYAKTTPVRNFKIREEK
jgi:putative phage-type endonuclease